MRVNETFMLVEGDCIYISQHWQRRQFFMNQREVGVSFYARSEKGKIMNLLSPADPFVGNPFVAIEHWATLVIHSWVNCAV